MKRYGPGSPSKQLGALSALLFILFICGIVSISVWPPKKDLVATLTLVSAFAILALLLVLYGFSTFFQLGSGSLIWGWLLSKKSVSAQGVKRWYTFGLPPFFGFRIQLNNGQVHTVYTATYQEGDQLSDALRAVLKDEKEDLNASENPEAKVERNVLLSILGIFPILGICVCLQPLWTHGPYPASNLILGGLAVGTWFVSFPFLLSHYSRTYQLQGSTIFVRQGDRTETYRLDDLQNAGFRRSSNSSGGKGHYHLVFPNKTLIIPSSQANFMRIAEAVEGRMPEPTPEQVSRARKARSLRLSSVMGFCLLILLVTDGLFGWLARNQFRLGSNPVEMSGQTLSAAKNIVRFEYQVDGVTYEAKDFLPSGEGAEGEPLQILVSATNPAVAVAKNSISLRPFFAYSTLTLAIMGYFAYVKWRRKVRGKEQETAKSNEV